MYCLLPFTFFRSSPCYEVLEREESGAEMVVPLKIAGIASLDALC